MLFFSRRFMFFINSCKNGSSYITTTFSNFQRWRNYLPAGNIFLMADIFQTPLSAIMMKELHIFRASLFAFAIS